jgi:transcriptional regulator with XRE-family HTH domain
MKPTPIGRRVRSLRTAAGLTQQALADKAGLNRLSVHYLESGKHRSVQIGTLRALAKTLKVTAADLLGA